MLMPRGPSACPIAGPGFAVPAGTRIRTVRTNDIFCLLPQMYADANQAVPLQSRQVAEPNSSLFHTLLCELSKLLSPFLVVKTWRGGIGGLAAEENELKIGIHRGSARRDPDLCTLWLVVSGFWCRVVVQG